MNVALFVIGAVLALLIASGALYQVVGSRVSARRHAAPGTMIDVEGSVSMSCAKEAGGRWCCSSLASPHRH